MPGDVEGFFYNTAKRYIAIAGDALLPWQPLVPPLPHSSLGSQCAFFSIVRARAHSLSLVAMHRWRNDNTLAEVNAYVAKETGLDPGSFQLVLPTDSLHGMASTTTIQEAGLTPRGLVVCKELPRL